MNVEMLLTRVKEIEAAITNASAQLNALHGHKAETAHWIQRLQSAQAEGSTPVECPELPMVE